jgi:hypothetical protein
LLNRSSFPRPVIIGVVAAVVIGAVVVALIAAQSSGGKSNAASSPSTTAHRTAGDTTSTSPVSVTASTAATATSLPLPDPKDLPLIVKVSKTTGLKDGETVSVHVVPKAGSDIFGIEARVCAPKANIVVETDFYPNQTGYCVLHALTPISDAHTDVAIAPPYQVADLSFRVGIGTDRYTTEYGESVSITCDHDHPCQLVLLLQVPGGFGFQSYPLTYS